MSYEIAQQRIAAARRMGSPRLNLSWMKLDRLPPELFDLTQLQVLWLRGNQLTNLPPEFGRLTQLHRLRLELNKLEVLPDEIGALTELRELLLYDNELERLPETIGQLTQLQLLALNGNRLTAVPMTLGKCYELRHLLLGDTIDLPGVRHDSDRGNQLTEVPRELSALVNLQYLGLDNNQLTEVPRELSALVNLQYLWLDNNQLTEVPRELSALVNLQYLVLDNNQLTEVPRELSALVNLRSLGLHNNQLTEVPRELSALVNLQSLGLDNNQLTEVPRELSALVNLQYLGLHNNQLTEVPRELSALVNLQSLWLDNNQLTEVPRELSALVNLRSLGLHNNQLTEVPRELSALVNLQYLGLHNNQLTEVPRELSALVNLQYLGLHNNQLTEVPRELSALVNLQYLGLDNNQLTEVPRELSALVNLRSLGLHNNQLTEVPRELSALVNLQSLRLANNRDLKIPPEIVEEGAQAVLDLIGQLPQPHWFSKLMLVGEGRHGKSSLLRALRDEPFVEDLDSTHGMEIGELALAHPRRNDVTMQLSTWDFGGQQIYHTMHSFFLTDRTLYVLVWDGQRRWEECKIEGWLETLALRAPHAPVLLVATHCPKDGRPADPPFAQLEETFPNLIGTHFQVDSKTGDGIAALRAKLIEIATDLPLMGELSPPAWTALKETLRTRRMTEKACTLAQLEDLMSAHGIAAPVSQKRLTRFLNELGEIIHYPDNPVLRDTVILDAKWVSQTISLVLDSPDVQRGLGLFRRATMNELWRHLPIGMPESMLSLMEEFDLSYRTLDDRDISIVVERLQQDPPEFWDEEWKTTPEPRTEITMEFKLSTDLPPGIPSWFIARQHRYTRNTHWRRGAVFADDQQQPKHWAYLEAYPEKKFLRLSVRGPAPHDFFSRMRHGLWETFNRYEGLRTGKFKVIETIPCPGQLDGEPCAYPHDVVDLTRKLERRRPMVCNRCDTELSVAQLLLGIRYEPTYEKLETIHADVRATRGDVQEMLGLIRLLQSDFATTFNAFQQYEEMQTPYVFALRGGTYSSDVQGLFGGTGARGSLLTSLRENLAKQKMELQLYCQAPGEWHPCGYERGKTDATTGLYQIEINADFLQALAPYAKKMAEMLKYAKPLAQAALLAHGLPPVVPDAANWIKENAEGMNKLAANLTALEENAEAKQSRKLSEAENVAMAEGALLRLLRRLLLAKDPDQKWGDLQRHYYKPEGHHLWLCPHHLQEYKQ